LAKKNPPATKVGGLLKLGLTAFYVPSAHTPPTLQAPVTGTRFRVFEVVLVVRANIEDEYIGARQNPSRSWDDAGNRLKH
jgi:hypothetical protein